MWQRGSHPGWLRYMNQCRDIVGSGLEEDSGPIAETDRLIAAGERVMVS